MKVLVRAKDGFVHGEYRMEPGQEAMMSEHLARELAHLVEVKVAPSHSNKMMLAGENKGNVSAAGEAQPSSASQAAQVSQQTTAKQSGRGAKRAKAGM